MQQVLIHGEPVERRPAFGINVVAEIGGVDAWIGGNLLFVEALDEVEGEVGGIAEAAVALHLQ